jgi:hypothetical protein
MKELNSDWDCRIANCSQYPNYVSKAAFASRGGLLLTGARRNDHDEQKANRRISDPRLLLFSSIHECMTNPRRPFDEYKLAECAEDMPGHIICQPLSAASSKMLRGSVADSVRTAGEGCDIR